MPDEKDILEEVELEVSEMSKEVLEAEAAKIFAQREKRKSYRSGPKTPEQLEKQAIYRKKRYAKEKAILARAKELGIEPEETE